ncbi:DUF1013 domain-containing protein [Ponticaulis sp.]|uniref:DUF1013 domain-containing protein n=1 Tax=Ponticaulis sp. TaxID=2020902 RepID=UPI000B6EBE7E|nr:cell cycle transcriptional regulator TrcR [Ponticaulis sp.]MAI90021.1 hypothetical protein [Ponticaulis sp.]OUX99681.1 MAG: hypothetical protein CBB65_06235 [Hyphomonadaceae bacterium TMED5]|tara:strand:+ start:19003 stop:19668 length:666 start_codon:yes stop_codon:yes gene_type:complete
MAKILMPKATAVWLIDNTTLTFQQIGDFCELHHLEVRGIADGDVAQSMRGVDPVARGELTRDEIAKGEADPNYTLKPIAHKVDKIVTEQKRKGARYTPISRRGDRPNAIAWFLFHHKEVSDAQISKIIGTTKATINTVRDRSHWNSANIKPVDPVTLGLCSQIELDALIAKASEKRRKMDEEAGLLSDQGLAPITPEETVEEETQEPSKEITAENLFKFNN